MPEGRLKLMYADLKALTSACMPTSDKKVYIEYGGRKMLIIYAGCCVNTKEDTEMHLNLLFNFVSMLALSDWFDHEFKLVDTRSHSMGLKPKSEIGSAVYCNTSISGVLDSKMKTGSYNNSKMKGCTVDLYVSDVRNMSHSTQNSTMIAAR